MSPLQKSVLITGCSAGGIGGALAEAFHAKGYHVFATLRTPAKISPKISGAANVTVLPLDVLSSQSISSAVENVKRETGGRLDVLVNNSGGVSIAPALDVSIEEGKRLFDLNYWAPLAVLQAFSPLLIEARGCVVNNASASAYATFGFNSMLPKCFRSHGHLLTEPGVYNSSKAALVAGSETWRNELQPLGVRTITLITSGVKTNAFSENRAVELPETSHYFGVQDFLRGLGDGQLQADAMDASVYAAKVVQHVEGGAVGPIWLGKDALLARLGWWLSPRSVFVSFLFNPSSLDMSLTQIQDMILESVVPVAGEMAKASNKKRK